MSTHEVISVLQKNTKRIRNLCILAHVDHGKTTIADCLLACNGIISNRMAGKLRYMDSTQEEQERGITMKASAVSLVHEYDKDDLYLINLIDSPGHVDFSTEVSTAVRLCDSAIIVIDVCEGICPQTHAVLRQASIEKLKLIVVLNKLDRLIVELQMTPQDAYLHLMQILEQLNALVAQQYASLVYEKDEETTDANLAEEITNWTEDIDETKLYFSPLHNNVVFASALDGFGFSVKTFANIYANKLGIQSDVLKKTLWGDFFYNPKTKRIMKGAQNQGKKPLFVSLVLENLWKIYESMIINKDKIMMEKIISSLNIKILPRDLKSNEPKAPLQALFNNWIPLSKALLDVVVEYLPGPAELTNEKVEHLMCSKSNQFKLLPPETQSLKEDFLKCSSDESRPLIVYISKMFAADKENICKNKRKPLTAEELTERRELVRQRKIEAASGAQVEKVVEPEDSEPLKDSNNNNESESKKYEFLAFARVFSGTIKKGQTLFVLLPKHNPQNFIEKNIEITSTVDEIQAVSKHVTKFLVNDIFLMMGRELQVMDEVPSGNIIAIGGLEGLVLKSATLSDKLYCPSFTDMFMQTTPILRVAIEPKHPANMKKLMEGLRLLNQSDPCVEIKVQSNGEHLLCTAGEVHLQRCIGDLVNQFAKCEVNVSPPRVPFRETIVTPPKFDFVNEKIETKSSAGDGSIEVFSKDRRTLLAVKAKPLPASLVQFIESNQPVIKMLNQVNESESIANEAVFNSIKEFKQNMQNEFQNCDDSAEWGSNFIEKIWSFGPNRTGSNLLVNNIASYQRTSIWALVNYETYADYLKDSDNRKKFYRFKDDNNIVLGFLLLTSKGPLCEEPLMGVCFLVDRFEQEDDLEKVTSEVAGLDLDFELELSDVKSVRSEDQKSIRSEDVDDESRKVTFVVNKNQTMLMMKEACKRAFEMQPQRLMAAMYKCQILSSSDALGKVYAVLGKRDCKILDESMKEGTSLFIINALLPVAESFGFAEELRKKTGGFASPHFEFSHFEAIDLDPFWEPKTEEEYLLYGDKADFVNKALKYVNDVRRRKGLFTKEKIVEHSEKQRTLGVK